MNVQVTKHSPGALVSPACSLGVSGLIIQRWEQPAASLRHGWVAGGSCQSIEALTLRGVQRVVGSCTALYLAGAS